MTTIEAYLSNPILCKLVNGDKIGPIHRHNNKGFGWHINLTPSGRYGYSGTIPVDGSFETIEEAVESCFAWLMANPSHVGDINTLIFEDFMQYVSDNK